jgi:hypothetical protein
VCGLPLVKAAKVAPCRVDGVLYRPGQCGDEGVVLLFRDAVFPVGYKLAVPLGIAGADVVGDGLGLADVDVLLSEGAVEVSGGEGGKLCHCSVPLCV